MAGLSERTAREVIFGETETLTGDEFRDIGKEKRDTAARTELVTT
jgi:hypothetical protein